MKRIFVRVAIIALILLASVYVFIPGRYIISSDASFGANREGVFRFLVNDSNWYKWWPGTISKDANGEILFSYNGYDFQIKNLFYNVIQLKEGKTNGFSDCWLKFLTYSIDSIGVDLSAEFVAGSDPFSRIYGYFHSKKIKGTLDVLVSSIKKYTSDLKNIYGIKIKKEKVQYSHVLSTKDSFNHYPTTGDVYTIISRLRDHIRKSGGQEVFSPMLNITMIDSIHYLARVAIPVDKELSQEENITSKWMMKGGNILSGEVTGGREQIEEAARQMELYIHDYQRSMIAIPFQMLITDRSKQPDSSKWVTIIYYPVV